MGILLFIDGRTKRLMRDLGLVIQRDPQHRNVKLTFASCLELKNKLDDLSSKLDEKKIEQPGENPPKKRKTRRGKKKNKPVSGVTSPKEIVENAVQDQPSRDDFAFIEPHGSASVLHESRSSQGDEKPNSSAVVGRERTNKVVDDVIRNDELDTKLRFMTFKVEGLKKLLHMDKPPISKGALALMEDDVEFINEHFIDDDYASRCYRFAQFHIDAEQARFDNQSREFNVSQRTVDTASRAVSGVATTALNAADTYLKYRQLQVATRGTNVSLGNLALSAAKFILKL